MRYEMKSKYLFALAIVAVFLTVSVVPLLAQPSYTVTVIIKDPSHTHGAVWLNQEGGARSHVYLTPNDPNPPCSPYPACYPYLQTQVDADTWSISVALTTDIPPNVPWSMSLPITVLVYDLVGYPTSSHYNTYCCYFLQGDFTGTFVVCYSPDVPVGGLCPTAVGGTAVGGLLIPANSFAVLSPWLAVIGLVGCIGTVVLVAKKRRY